MRLVQRSCFYSTLAVVQRLSSGVGPAGLELDSSRSGRLWKPSLRAAEVDVAPRYEASDAARRAGAAAHHAGVLRKVDLALSAPSVPADELAEALHAARPLFAPASWAALSEQVEAAARHVQATMGVPNVLVTIGKGGSVLYGPGGGEPLRQPAFPASKVVDTTGAGDCFRGTFAASLSSETRGAPRAGDTSPPRWAMSARETSSSRR